MSENLKLWESLERTEKKHTKNFNRAGFKGTAISPAYTCKKLTEAFGPCGSGWKFVQEDEKYVEGHTLSSGDKSIIHVVRGHLEYDCPVTGEKCETGPQYGHTVFVGENRNGVFTDDECQKKSVTDCLGKCAVLLGCSADVYLGIFDSSKYVNDRTNDGTKTGAAGSKVPRKSRPPASRTGGASTNTAVSKPTVPKRKVGAQAVSKPVKKKPTKKKPVKKKPASGNDRASAKRTVPKKIGLPRGSTKWLPEQYAEFVAAADDSAELVSRYSAAREKATQPAALQAVVTAVSSAMRALVPKDDAHWVGLTELLKADKGTLDSAS